MCSYLDFWLSIQKNKALNKKDVESLLFITGLDAKKFKKIYVKCTGSQKRTIFFLFCLIYEFY